MKNFNLKRILLILGLAIVAPIYFFTLFKYTGSKIVYTAFTIVAHLLLVSGFYKKAIFFDAFIGVFFWLGFWLKFSIRVAFFDGKFNESVGLFDRLPSSYDKALMIVIVAFSGLVIAQCLRRLLASDYKSINYLGSITPLSNLYFKYKKSIQLVFFCMVIFVGLTNYLYVIYQKGEISQSNFPWFVNSTYKWLLLFGLSSFVSMFLFIEMDKNRKPSCLILTLGLIENFVSNVSLLSRGSILNSTAIFYGSLVYANLKRIEMKFKSISILISSVLVFFVFSVYIVNIIRTDKFLDNINDPVKVAESRAYLAQQMTTPLFIDRWVGMEGVMAVSSIQNVGYDFLKKSFTEVYNENRPSFYDQLIDSSYSKENFNRHHFTSMPGIVGFLFYSGSLSFVFIAMLCLGLFASLVEIFSFKFSAGNIVFTSLIGQVIAYRFLNFGYVPNQTYLLFTAVFFNTLLFYFMIKVASVNPQVKKDIS